VIQTYTTNFIETLIDVYNVCASFVLIFLIAHIILMTHRVDKALLKARLFLTDIVTQQTWTYISIAGAALSVNTLIKVVMRFTTDGSMLGAYYLTELTQVIFLISFIMAMYNWYLFIGGSVVKK